MSIPFTKKIRVSTKLTNFNTGKLKVNDVKGSPIEVAAIVVWRINDAALAVLNLSDYNSFVTYQSDSALRTLVSKYAYYAEEGESLKSNVESITDVLKTELQARLQVAGVIVEEVRFSHLAYAPEIAAVMLKKQQAEATLEARRFLVKNALLIIDDVIEHFKKNENEKLIDYSLSLINNLLVTLVTESEVKPTINVGGKS